MLNDIQLLQPLGCLGWYGASVGVWMGTWVMAPQNVHTCRIQLFSTCSINGDGVRRPFRAWRESDISLVSSDPLRYRPTAISSRTAIYCSQFPSLSLVSRHCLLRTQSLLTPTFSQILLRPHARTIAVCIPKCALNSCWVCAWYPSRLL